MNFVIGLLFGSAITGITLHKMYRKRDIKEYKRGYEECYETYLDFRNNHREEYRKMSMSSY